MKTSSRILAVVMGLIVVITMSLFAFAQAKTPKDSYIMPAPNGGVKFDHKKHSAASKCDTCHHASKPEKAASAPQQACGDCHTKAATPPMKTKLQAAFHNPAAQSGTCIDCHKTQAKGPQPGKCMDCHKKENT